MVSLGGSGSCFREPRVGRSEEGYVEPVTGQEFPQPICCRTRRALSTDANDRSKPPARTGHHYASVCVVCVGAVVREYRSPSPNTRASFGPIRVSFFVFPPFGLSLTPLSPFDGVFGPSATSPHLSTDRCRRRTCLRKNASALAPSRPCHPSFDVLAVVCRQQQV